MQMLDVCVYVCVRALAQILCYSRREKINITQFKVHSKDYTTSMSAYKNAVSEDCTRKRNTG